MAIAAKGHDRLLQKHMDFLQHSDFLPMTKPVMQLSVQKSDWELYWKYIYQEMMSTG